MQSLPTCPGEIYIQYLLSYRYTPNIIGQTNSLAVQGHDNSTALGLQHTNLNSEQI